MKPSVPRLDSIIGFHPAIRFVVTAGKFGAILDAVKRRGVVSLEPSDEMRAVTERYAILYGLTQSSNDYFGGPRAIVVLGEKLIELIFPFSDRMVIISANPAFPLGKTAELQKLISSMQKD